MRLFNHTTSGVRLDVEVIPKMPRIRSNAVREGNNGPVPYYDYGSGEPAMAELFRVLKKGFDRMDKHFDRMISLFDQQEK